MADDYDVYLKPIDRLLQQVGELNGKADGILRELGDIKADNILCHADRENIYVEVGKIKNKVAYFTGIGTTCGVILGWISYHFVPWISAK